ncbi:hypothetical protein Dform_01546 [Dehalogenimonas formicexedens]|uniref:Uncharacterized protein n=1 Tax=Dehalogenimonas formicexedens TaxID=1839801 RepID=A0A1P8F8T6_9CHLR|nr:hypothetical protein [Dehalogenimonas formicexedens]APV44868.1 hypothetical protein Dform_01546 [Dehalogenimonas formicexedens]
MGGEEIFHVAAMPPAEMTPDLVSKIAAAVKQPDYQIRFQLAGGLPRMIGHFKELNEARQAAQSLTVLKVAAFTIAESELRRGVSPEITPFSIDLDDDQTIFTSHDGKNLTLNGADVFLILAGRRTGNFVEDTVAKSTMKVNVAATMLTGGIPVMKRVTTKTNEPLGIVEQFVRMYGRESDAPMVEICQFDFDYSFLGEKMELTTTCNFDTLVDFLKRRFQKAYFNGTMLAGFVPGSGGGPAIDVAEQSCLLLARYYRTMAEDQPGEAR